MWLGLFIIANVLFSGETCLPLHWLRYAFDYHARGALFYAIISSVKNYGSATFYLDLAKTPDGEWLDGGKNYKLVVPPKVPVRDRRSVMI